MDANAAAAVLGVRPGAPADEVRLAFRRLLHEHHPDRSAEGDAAARTREVIDAYRLLRSGVEALVTVAAEAPEEPEATVAVHDEVAVLSDDTLSLACPADEAFARLVEVGHLVGDVTYVDRLTGMLEVLVRTPDGIALSLVTSLQGRANGCTEVFVTLEPVGVPDVVVPPIAEATALLAHHVAERWNR